MYIKLTSEPADSSLGGKLSSNSAHLKEIHAGSSGLNCTDLGYLPLIPLVGARDVICKRLGAGKVVIAAWCRDDVSMTSNLSGEPSNRASDFPFKINFFSDGQDILTEESSSHSPWYISLNKTTPGKRLFHKEIASRQHNILHIDSDRICGTGSRIWVSGDGGVEHENPCCLEAG